MLHGTLLVWAVPVLVIAAILTFILRRPRLRVELSLRGTTRTGTLYAVVSNRGPHAARRVRVRLLWERGAERSRHEEVVIGDVPARDALRVEFARPHGLLRTDDVGWSAMRVRVVASNALPASARLEMAARRMPAGDGVAAVEYASGRLPCPDSPSGDHAFEDHPYFHDGVTERWHVCRRCRHVERDPLTPEEKATQARHRAARAAREQAKMEREFARREAEAGERAQGGEPGARRPRAGGSRAPTGERDMFPPEVAFYVLGLDGSRATWEDVTAAHRRLALVHHPDRARSEDPTSRAVHDQRMQEINRARDRLREHFGRRASVE